MSTVVLIQAQPRFASSGALTDVRLAGGGARAYDQLGFNDWRSGVANLPKFSALIGFDKEGLTGGAIPQTGGFRFFPSDRDYFSALGNVIWDGARIIVTTGDDEAVVPTYRQRLLGTVAAIQTEGGAITFTVADLSLDLDKPVCPNTFAGTGDLEGGDDATGRVKRRTYGRVFNVEGRLLDKAYNIYEFGDPSKALTSFDMVKDKGVAGPTTLVAWQGTAIATLNALRAASPPSGGAVAAPSIACVKWWTKPAGPLTADISAFLPVDRTPGRLAATIVSDAAPYIVVEDTTAAVSWANYDAGIHSDTSTETFGNLLDRLLLPVFIAWVLDGAGVFRFRRLTWEGPIAQLRAETISRQEVLPAIKGRKIGFQKNHRQQTDGEIAATLLLASDLTYADGTPLETLKPAEAGANITEARTAAAISGQGSLATLSQLDRTGGYLTGFGDLAGLANVYFGSPYLLEQAGGATATLNAFKTLLGTAASIAGQGALATLSQLANGGPYLSGFGALSSFSGIKAQAPQDGRQDYAAILTSYGDFLTDPAYRTGIGNAAGIFGQGALATRNNVTLGSPRTGVPTSDIVNVFGGALVDDDLFTRFGNAASFQGQGGLATLSFVQFGSSRTVLTQDGTTVTDVQVVTAVGVAAAFVGQGALSTRSDVDYDYIKIDSLRRMDADTDAGTYNAGDLGQTVKAGAISVIVDGVRNTGDLYITASGDVTIIPPPPGYVQVQDSRAFARLTYPSGSIREFNFTSGPVKMDLPSTESGRHIIEVYVQRGQTDQAPQGGDPGQQSPAIRLANAAAKLIWRAI